jgi:nucleoside-diphosphate-sugar epimerase
MKVFVAGATGVIGRRAVRRLVAAGHEVTGVARTPEKAAALRAFGAEPVAVSLFDAAALRDAVAGHDAVVNLATRIPTIRESMRVSAWEENNRIRIEGSRNLVDAALATGARVYVQESLAFVYGEHGDAWLDAERTPLHDSPFTDPVRAAEANAARFTEHGGRGVVLRFGVFQAGDGHHTTTILHTARRGFLLEVARPDAYVPAIDADDAADAVVFAVEGAPAGAYDIVDDEPLTRRDVAEALARTVGRRRLRRPPGSGLARSKAGPLTDSQRVSNARFRAVTGWRPATRNQADAIAKAAAEMGLQPALGLGARVCSWLLALTGLSLGLYATLAPRHFYDEFPFGRSWVAHDGPYNEHLVRDFGAMNLALTAITLLALYFGTKVLVRVAATGWLVFSIPHALYHFTNLEHYDTADQIGNVVSLTLGIALAVGAFVLAGRGRARAEASYDGRGEPLPEHAAAGLRDDDLRRDDGPGAGDRIDQPGARVP